MNGRTVLLVEDNPLTRNLVRVTLERSGYRVLEAADGRTAVELLGASDPGLILQDLALPDTDGFELIGKLRSVARAADLPIVAFSGVLSNIDEQRLSAVGFDDLVTKPVEPTQLLRIIEMHLPSRAADPRPFGLGRRALIADDDAAQRRLVAFRLTAAGFAVASCADGAEALESIKERPPDIVVSDVMMPNLDGFGLCVEVRKIPELAGVPIILVSSAYVEDEDRELALRAGATGFVHRSPDLQEILAAMAAALAGRNPRPTSPPAHNLERQRIERALHQLEKQVALNARVARRCTELSAELTVLRDISGALAHHQDVDSALDQALAACFDAAGVSVGAMYEGHDRDRLRVRRIGTYAHLEPGELESFFGHPELLAGIIAAGQAAPIPASINPTDAERHLLGRCGAACALVVPIVYQDARFGALLMISRSTDLVLPDRVAFAQSVAAQIGQTLLLAQTFAEKVESERQARRQADTLRSIIDSIADGISVSDEHGDVVLRNRRALAEMPELMSLYRADKVTPFPAAELPLARAARGEAVDGIEIFVRPATEGPGRWLRVSSRPVVDESGAARGGVSVFRDVTAEKAAQEQLTVSDRMVSIGMLASGVAHEINNPLSSVIANLDLAKRDIAALTARLGEVGELLELGAEIKDARESAQAIRGIVRDLRIFSRADDDRRNPVDVERVIESALRMAWTEIRHRARVIKRYGAVPRVHGSESRLGQVFLNLLVNAAQAIDEGNAEANAITIVIRPVDDRRVGVDIIDSGHGMSAEVQQRLFTPFFTTKPPGVGTGLGLTICQRIINGLGGEISVDSSPGRGTAFRVVLPISTTVSPISAEARPVTPAERRGRILVIDDEQELLTALRRTLAPPHEVITRLRAAEGLELIGAGERFDVILSDLMMPDMTGMELFGELSKVAPDQARRIVFVTGGAFTPKARAFLEEATNFHIEKPFDPADLQRLVQKVLGGRE